MSTKPQPEEIPEEQWQEQEFGDEEVGEEDVQQMVNDLLGESMVTQEGHQGYEGNEEGHEGQGSSSFFVIELQVGYCHCHAGVSAATLSSNSKLDSDDAERQLS